MNKLVFLLLAIAQSLAVFSQPVKELRLDAIKKVVEGYNRQDYGLMKQPCDTGFRNNVPDEALAEQYRPYYENYGKATIDIVRTSFSDEDRYVAKLKMEKQPGDNVYWQFYFNEEAEIVGYGDGYPNMCYRKCNSLKQMNRSRLTAGIDALMSEKYLKDSIQSFNGSIVVMDNGKAVYNRHFGYADLFSKTAINDSTIYELASCSKQFVAAGILLLAKQGRIALTDSVQKFIPGFPYRGITIEHLLSHTSGLPDYMSLMKEVWDHNKPGSNDEMVALLAKHKPEILFWPGEKFRYSNTGYALLPVIIEKATGKPYAGYMRENIFIPLGMKHTHVYTAAQIREKKIGNSTTGFMFSEKHKRYMRSDSVKDYVKYLGPITGDGGIYSCTKDLIKWESELLKPTVLGKELITALTASRKLNSGSNTGYGYGFFLNRDTDLEPVVFHTGGWPGYSTILMNFFEQKKQIIILSNNDYDGFTRLADDIALMLVSN